MSAGGLIDFSNHLQLIRTLNMPTRNITNDNFLANSIISSDFFIELEPASNIQIIIDSIVQEIDSNKIRSVRI